MAYIYADDVPYYFDSKKERGKISELEVRVFDLLRLVESMRATIDAQNELIKTYEKNIKTLEEINKLREMQVEKLKGCFS